MTQTLAYQIGAVFFLATLMIAGTMTRGLIPHAFFKNAKLTLGAATVMVGGYAAYRALPDMSTWLRSGPDTAAAEPTPASPQATKAQIKRTVAPRPATSTSATATPTTLASGAVIREVDTPAHPVVEPSPVVVRNPATDPDQEGKGKKVLKSVGRFLHITHKTGDPPTP